MKVFYFKKLSDFMFFVIEKIAVKMKKLLPLYLKYYDDIANKEIDIANISSSDKFLHMGVGSLPSTSILIAKKTGATAIGIDRNSSSVKEANLCIHLFNLDGIAQIKNEEAMNFPVKNFDVIIVSQGIEPRDEILKYVSQSMKDDARVILRTFSSVEGEITEYDTLLKSIFKIGKIAPHENHGLLASVVLFKK